MQFVIEKEAIVQKGQLSIVTNKKRMTKTFLVTPLFENIVRDTSLNQK